MPSKFVLELLLITVAIPLASTAVLLALSGRGPGRAGSRAAGITATAIVIGWLSGYVAIYGWPAFPPQQAQDWLPLILIAAYILYGSLEFVAPTVTARRLVLASFIIAAAMVLMLPIFRYNAGVESILTGAAVVIGWIAVAWNHDSAGREDGVFGLLALLVTIGNAVIAASAGSVMLGQLSGALASVIGIWWLWHILLQRRPLSRTGRGMIIASVALLLLIGQCYGDTPLWATLLLLAVLGLEHPIAALAGRIVRHDLVFAHCAVVVALAGTPLAVSIYYIVRTHLQPGEF